MTAAVRLPTIRRWCLIVPPPRQSRDREKTDESYPLWSRCRFLRDDGNDGSDALVWGVSRGGSALRDLRPAPKLFDILRTMFRTAWGARLTQTETMAVSLKREVARIGKHVRGISRLPTKSWQKDGGRVVPSKKCSNSP